MDIESAKTIVERRALPPAVSAELRRAARVRSTHFSTRIEGNRLKELMGAGLVSCLGRSKPSLSDRCA